MLHFLVTADHGYTLQEYFSQWGAHLSGEASIWHYEARPWNREPQPGAWIFTDIERLRGDEFRAACDLAQRLSEDPSRWRVLNDPRRVLLRYALLRDLAGARINDFRVFRLPDIPDDARYPIFLRGENDHQGAMTGLLHDAKQLRDVARNLSGEDKLLAVEYLPYRREDGLFVKYSMMRIGDQLVPRHVLFSHEWVLKDPDMLEEQLMQEEDRFIRESPHRQAVQQVFQRAGIEYGRIDYTVANGRIQVFEINTNPVVLQGVAKLSPRRWASQVTSARQVNDALGKLAAGLPVADPVRVAADRRQHRQRMRAHYLLRRLGMRPRARV